MDVFQLSDNRLSFLISERQSTQQYLWSQIELCANQSNFELCEGLIDVWLNHSNDYNKSIAIIAQFLVKCFQQNHDIWFIYQIIKKYNFHQLINEKELQLKLLLINGLDANQTQLEDIIYISKCDDLSTLDDKYLSIMRNLILKKPKMAQLVINLLVDNERLNYLYSQCLIHALKDHNKRLILDILSVFPDQQINQTNINLLEEVYDEFSSDNSEQQIMLVYRSCILRETTKLIHTFCSISRMRNKALAYDCSSQKFNFKECFLLAAYHNKHFIIEMLDDSDICFHLPPKQRLFFLIYNLHKSDLKVERFIRIESEINSLINNCAEMSAFCEKDSALEALVKRLRIIIKFSNWCANQLKPNSNSQIHFAIFQSLFLGESPLKVLRKYGFLGEKDNVNNGDNIDQICDFLRDYSESELMIYRGFLALRYSIMWIILADDKPDDNNDFGEKNSLLLKNIHPLAYKLEILENIFSLLFLTQNELKDSDMDCDHREESTRKELLSKFSTSNTTIAASFGSTYFLCPNILVPKLISLLKEATSDAQTSLFTYLYPYNNIEEPKINIDMSIKDSAECKTRIERLMLYINEAQWRFSVIEPAFNKDLSLQESKKAKSLLSLDGSDDDIMDDIEFIRSLSSTSGSETERKQPKEIFSSLICCMLASPIQLLRYSLIKNQLERAKQVVKLFEQSLMDTEEAKELAIIEKWRDLSTNLSALSAPTKASNVNVSKIGQIAATGLKSTQIQSAIHEFLFKLEVNDLIKNSLIIDFALTSSQSMETSKVILETILQNPNLNDILPEKVTLFLGKIYSFIGEISKEFDVNKLTLAKLFTHYTQCNNFCDAISYIEDKRTKTKIKIAYDDLRNHLIDLEYKNEDMSLRKSISNSESKKTTILFDKLFRVCPSANYNYLRELFYYVRKMSRSLTECQQSSKSVVISCYAESSYFSILKQSPSAILCSMILKDNISPKIVDNFAKEMKVDLIGTLCSVLCPQIPTHFLNESPAEFVIIDTSHPALCELIQMHLRGDKQFNYDLESVMIQNHFDDETDTSSSLTKPKIRNDELISYFKIKCPIIVELMKLFKLIDEEEEGINIDFKFKSDSPLIRWIEMVKEKFLGTPSVDYASVITLALSPRILVGHTVVNKTLEFLALKANLLEMYDIFKYIDESISFSVPNPSYKALRNAVLSRLAIEQEDVKYALQIIDDPQTKCDVILQLVNTSTIFSDSAIALRNINTCLDSLDFETQFSSQDLILLKQKLIAKCKEIEFYVKIGHLTGLRQWTDAQYNLTSIDILTIIKSKKKYSLAVEWHDIRGMETETADLHYELLILAYCENNDITALTQILSIFDENITHSLDLITKIINLIDNLKFRRFLVEYVMEHYSYRLNEKQHEYYTNYLIGVKLIETLNVDVRPHYINLLTKPFVLIEQMLMNVEMESLEIAIIDLKLICVDFLIEKYAQKAVEVQIYDASSSGNSIISDATIISSTTCRPQATQPLSPQFVMPVSIPTREQWVPDSKVSHCMICFAEKFSMLNRRHHCRRCGRVVCANCSQNTLVIPEINATALVRVCNECYYQTIVNRKDNNSSLSVTSNRKPQTTWFLTCDDLHNDSVRLEFYYESSPSVSLCLTLLKLHSDRNRCSDIIVDSICRPLLETISSNQVDYGLVIGMIRSLLVSVSSSPEHSSYELRNKVNFISSRMDTIRILINSNCNTKELISHALSTNDNSILKLQEKLIEMEQFELAIEIATKFGFDSNSILKTWAYVCLRNGQFIEAKLKLKNCLNVKSQTEIKKILNEIIGILSKQNAMSNISLREKCRQIENGKLEFESSIKSADVIKIDNDVYKEIMYYLEEYGQRDDIIKFYGKNLMWKKAVDLYLDNQNLLTNTELFIHHLFMPAVRKGALLSLLNLLKPKIKSFFSCLSNTCKYLEKERLHSVLYDLLIFMDDQLGAAIIQLELYLIPAVSNYSELYNRIDNLEKAINHCANYVSRDEKSLPVGCLKMETSEVLRLNKTLNLQIDITTKFNEKRMTGFLPFNAYSERYYNTPPTLFDKRKSRKTELAALVISSYGSVAEGFKLSHNIITVLDLEAAQVYKLSARALAHTPNSNVKDLLLQLLDCIKGTSPSINRDEIIFTAVENCANKVDADSLIQLISNKSRKIDAYIRSGLLKAAYLVAVESKSGKDITRIEEAAQQMNQLRIRDMCIQWKAIYGDQ